MEEPDYILPWNHRLSTSDKSRTVICFYEDDKFLYRRLSNFEEELSFYKEYMGICGFDLSPRSGWSNGLQKFNIVLSQMLTAYYSIHGIKIISNFIIGDLNTINCLDSYPKNNAFVVGALGNYNRDLDSEEISYFFTKLIYTNPSKLYIYGKLEPELTKIAESFCSVKVYNDFRTISFQKSLLKKGGKQNV